MENQVFESANLFEVTKQSFVTVGGITKNCIRLLSKNTKKDKGHDIVFGDCRGIIYSITYLNEEPKIIIKTEPYPKEIVCVEIEPDTQRIYFAVGNSIYSIDKDNKNKWKVEFNIASDIQIFKVIGSNIWTVTNNFINKFVFGEVTNSCYTYDNKTKITSFIITDVTINEKLVLLIGSEDDKIKVNEENETVHIIPTKGAPTCFCLGKLTTDDECNNYYYFGTYLGSLGCVKIKDENEMELIFESKKQKEQFDIIDLKVADINYDLKCELIAIRANGDVEIYSILDDYQNVNLICKYETKETLTGLEIGKYKDNDHIEIILSSLTGLVFSLMPKIVLEKKNIDAKALRESIEKEKNDIERLKEKLKAKKDEFAKKNKSADTATKNNFKINYKFSLIFKQSLFQLSLDSEFPMEIVIISCPKTKIDIVELKTKEVNLNIIDEKAMDKDTISQYKFIATLSMKDSIHHLELMLRTYEGQNDEIHICVIPYNKPKTAQYIKIPVYALSFHKIYEPEYETELESCVLGCSDEKITNKLEIDNIRPSEINQILHLIIPNIPEQIEEDKAHYILRSTFLNTLVEINIENNRCEIKSPFISTLMTLKKQISKEAELRRKRINTPITFNRFSVGKILELFDPKIQEIFNLEKEYKIFMAFKELGDSVSNEELPEKYLVIKNKGDEICKKYGNRTLNLNYYKCLLEQLFLDIKEVYAVDSDKLDEIEMLMTDYSFDKLKKIFSFLN